MIRNENEIELLREWLKRAVAARDKANEILAFHEQSPARVIILEDLVQKLDGLPVDVQDYFREATKCIEQGLLRAAVVLSWSGFFHVLVEKMYTEHETELRQNRPKWRFKDLAELKENYVEFQLLEVTQKVGLIGKSDLNVYKGQLAERNRCAHPTLYRPSLNSALGFADNMLRQTISLL